MSTGSSDDLLWLWAQARVRGVVARAMLAVRGEIALLTDDLDGSQPVPRHRVVPSSPAPAPSPAPQRPPRQVPLPLKRRGE